MSQTYAPLYLPEGGKPRAFVCLHPVVSQGFPGPVEHQECGAVCKSQRNIRIHLKRKHQLSLQAALFPELVVGGGR